MASTIHVPTLASESVMHIGAFDIRNTLIMAWMTMTVLILGALLLRVRGFTLVPGRLQTAAEMLIEGLHDFFNGVFQNEKMTRRFFPLLATLFLFIMIGNWLGILPGVGSITVAAEHNGVLAQVPLLRSMNADVNMTLVYAIVAAILAQVVGIAALGPFHHLGKYFVVPWKKPYGIGTFLGLIEFLGEFIRVISFTFRLFGNIFAGEVLLMVIAFLAPYAMLPFLGLEIFVGFVQALVFAMLTSVFLLMAVSHGEHEAAH